MTKIDTHTRLKDLSAKQTAENEEDFPAIVLFLCFSSVVVVQYGPQFST